jgi:glucose/arabinose dehydrogenase
LPRLALFAVAVAACGDGISPPSTSIADAALAVTDEPADAALADAMPDATPAPAPCLTPPAVALAPLLRIDGQPVMVAAPPGDPRLFIVEKAGRIHIAVDGVVNAAPFLDWRAESGGPVDAFNEKGLLALAFHPTFAVSGRFFVFYTAAAESRIAELRAVPDDGDRADPASERIVLAIPTASASHVGGMIGFGPDGLLWASTGDDYFEGDAPAQDLGRLHGKLLRLDVDSDDPIPVDNPYVASAGARPEIWASGLRNPWRWSFDAATGDLYLADVGEALVEEIDVVPATRAGANYGWGWYEGNHPRRRDEAPAGTVAPAVVHDHEDGWAAIIGGAVYRGARYPDLVGRYLYGDWLRGELWTFRWLGDRAVDHCAVAPTPAGITSIGADGAGELYATHIDGDVYRVVGDRDVSGGAAAAPTPSRRP